MQQIKRNVIFNSGLVKICEFLGAEAIPFAKDIARMRLLNFKEYPYLYDGEEEDELKYLQTYFKCPHTSILLVFDNNEIVGFSNSLPLADESEDMISTFLSQGLDPNEFLYSGECILNEQYRGKKFASLMMTHHENRARTLGLPYITLMTVDKAENHPLRRPGYVPTNEVLRHMGYKTIDGVIENTFWKSSETGQIETHSLFFWQKDVRQI